MNKAIGLKFPISTMAEEINAHQRTLRIWDKKEILQPKRTESNRRVYDLYDLRRAKVIQYLLRLGVGLPGVKIILHIIDEHVGNNDDLELVKELAQDLGLSIMPNNRGRKKIQK